MGCFNVACSASKLSINSGDPVVFVPLLHKSFDYVSRFGILRSMQSREHTGGYFRSLGCYADRMLIYSNAIYNPLSFPIKGEYNDYGSIENVERNANVEAIEKFFKMKIEDLVGYDERDYHYIENKRLFDDYSIEFDGELLKRLGFTEHEPNFFFLDTPEFKQSHKFMVVLKENKITDKRFQEFNKYTYDIVLIKDNDIDVRKGHNQTNGRNIFVDFIEHWKNVTGWHLGVAPENQLLKDICDFMGGMFFHRDIYEAMMENQLTEGFFQPPDFETVFDRVQKTIIDFDTVEEKKAKFLKEYSETKDKKEKKKLMKIYCDLPMFHPLNSSSEGDRFECKNWPFFKSIYEDAFRQGSIKTDFIEWSKFAHSAHSANIHWAPAMNGEQHGNDDESRKLYEAALNVLDKRKIQYEADHV